MSIKRVIKVRHLRPAPPRLGDIGEPLRTREYEPVPESVPVPEHVPAAPEKVPA